MRFETIPTRCRLRSKKHLHRAELLDLADWMYARRGRRGRVKNCNLIKKARSRDVLKQTIKGFQHWSSNRNARSAIESLMSLKGVGLKTATLILASAFPEEVPYFSHELCAWVGVQPGYEKHDKYDQLLLKVQKFIMISREKDCPVTAVEMEKVAFVVARSKKMQGIYSSNSSHFQKASF
ncbi:hypothetical protein BJ166DRAFT_502177 [Pestalotiopsis sp. NC0098]|nr:hypothetical protein BJ166DRAFT_502177 [Pestalotiopsis sp. NC0098]